MAYVDKINKENVDYDIQDSKAARSVDGTTASHVEEANQIYTTTGVAQTDYFIYRTTAGDASINTGPATLVKVIGHTEQIGHTDESFVTSTSFTNPSTTISIDKDTWRGNVSNSGTYEFTYNAGWKLNGTTVVTLSDYGITVTGNVSISDSFTVVYTKLVVGTMTTATPTAFIATGYNQYDATAGYAHVIGDNQYRIAGTYTSLGFTTTVGGTTTAVTVTDGKFTPTEDGYIYVTGASGNILIALVWSGIRDSDPFEAYETDTIAIPTADASATSLPTASYGMPSVGSVYDELSFSDKKYYQRIGHYTYSAENLATVEAMGVDYIWDNSDIFYVLGTPIEYTLASTTDGTYTANDFGTEEFTGTSATVGVSLYYGNNLVDKLRNLADIQTIGTGLTLTNGELSSSGGSNYTFYSTVNTSNDNTAGGAVYIGNLKANQEEITDPTPADYHRRFFHALPSQNIAPDDMSVNILGRTGGSYSVALNYAVANTTYAIAIGYNASVYGAASRGVAIGTASLAAKANSVALGTNAKADRIGEVNVGASTSGNGYDGTNYRVIGGVHDGVDTHDAATVAQGNTLSTTAPTTSTVGVLGQLYTDTTNMHTYQLTAISGDTYTWTMRW